MHAIQCSLCTQRLLVEIEGSDPRDLPAELPEAGLAVDSVELRRKLPLHARRHPRSHPCRADLQQAERLATNWKRPESISLQCAHCSRSSRRPAVLLRSKDKPGIKILRGVE